MSVPPELEKLFMHRPGNVLELEGAIPHPNTAVFILTHPGDFGTEPSRNGKMKSW